MDLYRKVTQSLVHDHNSRSSAVPYFQNHPNLHISEIKYCKGPITLPNSHKQHWDRTVNQRAQYSSFPPQSLSKLSEPFSKIASTCYNDGISLVCTFRFPSKDLGVPKIWMKLKLKEYSVIKTSHRKIKALNIFTTERRKCFNFPKLPSVTYFSYEQEPSCFSF